MNYVSEIAYILLSYLLGSIPFGYILTKGATGENIMEMGSGNTGSTNVGRVAGKKIAIITQLLDMAKGLIPVALFLYFVNDKTLFLDYYVYYLALASILGHDFSIFLKFKGGKGVNTTLGASLLLAPIAVFVSVAIYFIVKSRFRFVSIGSIILGISLPFTNLIIHGFTATFYYLLVCMTLIILMHKSNLSRLLNHQELNS